MSRKRQFARRIKVVGNPQPYTSASRPSRQPETYVSPADAMRGVVERAKGKSIPDQPGRLARLGYSLSAAAYTARAAWLFLVRSKPREAMAMFAVAIAYAAMAKDRGVK